MTKSNLTLAIGIPSIILIVGVMIWMNSINKLDNGWQSIFEVSASTILSFCLLLITAKQYDAERNRNLPQLRLDEKIEHIAFKDIYTTQLVNDGPAINRWKRIELYNVLELQIIKQIDNEKTIVLDAYRFPIVLPGLNLAPTGRHRGVIATFESTGCHNGYYSNMISEQMAKKNIRCKESINIKPVYWNYLMLTYTDFDEKSHQEYLLPYCNLSKTEFNKQKTEAERLLGCKAKKIEEVCVSLMKICGKYFDTDWIKQQ